MNVCEKIDKFENHVLGRQLRIAQILGEHFTDGKDDEELSQSAFAILSIVISYFEMIEQFTVGEPSRGPGQSEKFFIAGFNSVFPSSEVNLNDTDIKKLYSNVRCGMYHTAMPYERSGLTRELQTAIAIENCVVVINPALLVDRLIEHFNEICVKLRSGEDCDLQRNFEKMFDHLTDRITISTQANTLATSNPCDNYGLSTSPTYTSPR